MTCTTNSYTHNSDVRELLSTKRKLFEQAISRDSAKLFQPFFNTVSMIMVRTTWTLSAPPPPPPTGTHTYKPCNLQEVLVQGWKSVFHYKTYLCPPSISRHDLLGTIVLVSYTECVGSYASIKLSSMSHLASPGDPWT